MTRGRLSGLLILAIVAHTLLSALAAVAVWEWFGPVGVAAYIVGSAFWLVRVAGLVMTRWDIVKVFVSSVETPPTLTDP